jgi:hypothetical protein
MKKLREEGPIIKDISDLMLARVRLQTFPSGKEEIGGGRIPLAKAREFGGGWGNQRAISW